MGGLYCKGGMAKGVKNFTTLITMMVESEKYEDDVGATRVWLSVYVKCFEFM